MFSATENAVFAEGVIKCAGVPYHLLDIVTVTTPAQGIIGIIIEGNVENRTEVHVESKHPQQPRRDLPVLADQPEVAFVPELIRIRRLVAELDGSANLPE